MFEFMKIINETRYRSKAFEQLWKKKRRLGAGKKSSAPFCNESDALLHCVVPTHKSDVRR